MKILLLCFIYFVYCFCEEVHKITVEGVNKNEMLRSKRSKVQPLDMVIKPKPKYDHLKLHVDVNDVFLPVESKQPITNLKMKTAGKTVPHLKRINHRVKPLNVRFPISTNIKVTVPKMNTTIGGNHKDIIVSQSPIKRNEELQNKVNCTKEILPKNLTVVTNCEIKSETIDNLNISTTIVKNETNDKSHHQDHNVKNKDVHADPVLKIQNKLELITDTPSRNETKSKEDKLATNVTETRNSNDNDKSFLEKVIKELPNLIKTTEKGKKSSKLSDDCTPFPSNFTLTLSKVSRNNETLNLLIEPAINNSTNNSNDITEISWTTEVKNENRDIIKIKQGNCTNHLENAQDVEKKAKSKNSSAPDNKMPEQTISHATEQSIELSYDDGFSTKTIHKSMTNNLTPDIIELKNILSSYLTKSAPNYDILQPETGKSYYMDQTQNGPEITYMKPPKYNSDPISDNEMDSYGLKRFIESWTNTGSMSNANNECSETQVVAEKHSVEKSNDNTYLPKQKPQMFSSQTNREPMFYNYYNNQFRYPLSHGQNLLTNVYSQPSDTHSSMISYYPSHLFVMNHPKEFVD